jgi:hypothetical protein
MEKKARQGLYTLLIYVKWRQVTTCHYFWRNTPLFYFNLFLNFRIA